MPLALDRWWPVLFYAALVVLFTWPLVTEVREALPGAETDAYVHLWTFNWVAESWARHPLDLHTDRIFFPVGVSMLNHNIAWLNVAVWLLFRPLFGPFGAYTLSILLFLVFNANVLHLLAEAATGSRRSALLAGTVGATWPAILTELNHPNMVVVGLIPLAMWSLRRLILAGRRRARWQDVMLSGVLVGLIGIARIQLLMMSVILIGPYVLYLLTREQRWSNLRTVRRLAAVGLLAAVIAAPVVVPLLVHQLSRANPGDLYASVTEDPTLDLLHLVLPSKIHPLWGDLSRAVAEGIGVGTFPLPPGYFLGVVVVGLAVVAVAYGRPRTRARFWGAAAAVLTLLSLGPELHLVGRVVRLPLYTPLYERVLMPWLREPRRFAVLLVVPMGLLAGLGWQRLTQVPWLNRPRQWWLWGVLLVLVPVEFALHPFPTLATDAPDWSATLAAEPDEFGILALPMGRHYSEIYMLDQLTHRKHLIRGHVSRPPREAYRFIESVALLAELMATEGRRPPVSAAEMDVAAQLEMLSAADVRYIVIHRWLLGDGDEARWRRFLAVPPSYEDRDVIVYATDSAAWGHPFAYYREHQDRIHALAAELSPPAVIQAGWTELSVDWYVPPDVTVKGGELCLTVMDDRGVGVERRCDLSVTGDPEMPLASGRFTAVYQLQADPDWPAGEYALGYVGPDAAGANSEGAVIPLGVTLQVTPRLGRFEPPSPAHPVNVRFADQIALLGYDVSGGVGATLHLTLYWQALRAPPTSYRVFVHLVDAASGEIVAQDDHVPVDWQYPTDLWAEGEYVADPVTLDLAGLPAGTYRLLVGLYGPPTGARLAADPPAPNDAVLLVELEP